MRIATAAILAALFAGAGPAMADTRLDAARHLQKAQDALSHAVVGTCDSFDRLSRFRKMDRRLVAARDAYIRRFGEPEDDGLLIIEGDNCTLEDRFEASIRRAGMEVKAAERLLRR